MKVNGSRRAALRDDSAMMSKQTTLFKENFVTRTVIVQVVKSTSEA
jgi:hypothetical protein